MDEKILKLIKKNSVLENVLKSIIEIEELYKSDSKLFKNVKSAFKAITKVLKNNGINHDTDDRIKKITYDNIKIIGFSHGDMEHTHFNVILCKFLRKFGSKLYDKYGVSIFSCTFGWDSSSCLVIGGHENPDADMFEDLELLERFVLDKINPNGNLVYY